MTKIGIKVKISSFIESSMRLSCPKLGMRWQLWTICVTGITVACWRWLRVDQEIWNIIRSSLNIWSGMYQWIYASGCGIEGRLKNKLHLGNAKLGIAHCKYAQNLWTASWWVSQMVICLIYAFLFDAQYLNLARSMCRGSVPSVLKPSTVPQERMEST